MPSRQPRRITGGWRHGGMPLTTDTTDDRRLGGTEACPHDRHDGSQEVGRHGGVPSRQTRRITGGWEARRRALTTDTTDDRRFGGTEACPSRRTRRITGGSEARRRALTTDTTDHRRFGGTEACPSRRITGGVKARSGIVRRAWASGRAARPRLKPGTSDPLPFRVSV